MTDTKTNKTFDYPGLPKWPALLVVGDPVTKEQAAEIILRTNSQYFGGNDKQWERKIYEILGIRYTVDRSWVDVDYDSQDAYGKSIGLLEDLEYLQTRRIYSAWIGGPHGWVDWFGNVGCNNYNIGKYPDAEGVHEEWKKIAAAFPFLSLRAQLMNGEGCEEGTQSVIEYVVHGGECGAVIPTKQIAMPTEIPVSAILAIAVRGTGRERGCTAEQLRWAFETTKQRVAAQA